MSIHEKCGVWGICNHPRAFELTAAALLALEHRGPGGSGIAGILDDTRALRIVKQFGLPSRFLVPAMLEIQGLVSEFAGGGTNKEMLEAVGSIAGIRKAEELLELSNATSMVGHTHYLTTMFKKQRKRRDPRLLHPHFTRLPQGMIALAENGDVRNAESEWAWLAEHGVKMDTHNDAEVIAASINFHITKKGQTLVQAIASSMPYLHGGYAVVLVTEFDDRLFGFCDPLAIRPLWIGEFTLNDGGRRYCLASETCAFTAVGAHPVRMVEPGEIVAITPDGVLESYRGMDLPAEMKPARCVFEYIYFGRPDSDADEPNCTMPRTMYDVRRELGRELARMLQARMPGIRMPDIVIGVPESGMPGAIGTAFQLGVPFEWGLIKNPSIKRTFITPEGERNLMADMKYYVLRNAVRGKWVVIVDDSLIRGTTMRRIVKMLRDAGAAGVYVLLTYPRWRFPCYYGIDTKDPAEFIAAEDTSEEAIAQAIGADLVIYLPLDIIERVIGRTGHCAACVTGIYPDELLQAALGRTQS